MPSIFQKWGFWLSANNRHGVHSPFVYQFLDQGLYAPHLRGMPPGKRLLAAALEYFRPGRIGLSADPETPRQLPLLPVGGSLSEDPPYDLFIFGTPSGSVTNFLLKEDHWHNDSIVFVGGLRTSVEAHRQWGQLCRQPPVRIVVETFGAGLLFFRKEQAPQHFKIRT
jgi:hypothetical protein